MTATAFDDQVGAATRDARHVLARLAATTQRPLFIDVPGPFVRRLLADTARADKRGRLRRCRHLSGRGPAPSWIVAWKAGRLYCHGCAKAEFSAVQATPEDNVCDVCRDTVPTLWPVTGQTGPALIFFGACRRCYENETGLVAT